MRGLRLLMAALLLGGCPGSDDDDNTPKTASDFAGMWKGTTKVTIGNKEAYSYAAEMVATAEGKVLTLKEVCPGGDGSIEATVAEGIASWEGSLECEAVVVDQCASVVITYTSGGLSIADGKITATVVGISVGCDQEIAMSGTFVGVRIPGTTAAITDAQLCQFQYGATTSSAVIALLGEPTMRDDANGTLLVYEYGLPQNDDWVQTTFSFGGPNNTLLRVDRTEAGGVTGELPGCL